jgi:hypothetical protein
MNIEIGQHARSQLRTRLKYTGTNAELLIKLNTFANEGYQVPNGDTVCLMFPNCRIKVPIATHSIKPDFWFAKTVLSCKIGNLSKYKKFEVKWFILHSEESHGI